MTVWLIDHAERGVQPDHAHAAAAVRAAAVAAVRIVMGRHEGYTKIDAC